MRFLQPWMLWALPVIALPILVHLIHRRRTRVVEWGAMMFLLQGARLSKGMQRLRHFLLLALRTIAVAGLVVGLGRPLAGGWLGGVGGGRPDTVIVLLDRSASMSELVDGRTKLERGVARVAEALENVEAARLAVVESVGRTLIELESPADLVDLPVAGETSTHADLPALFEVAAEHLRANQAGRAELWVCTDGQEGDWRPDDGRWPALQEALIGLPAGVRVNVLQLAERSPDNLSVRVLRAERVPGEGRAELSLDLVVRAASPLGEAREVPVAIVLGGARSVAQVELNGDTARLRGHRVGLASPEAVGWGYVELPADDDLEDNRAYFTYGHGAQQESVLVCEDRGVQDVLRFATEAPTSDRVEYTTHTQSPDEGSGLDLSRASALFWQAPLPTGEAALEVERFLDAGGQALFLPPGTPGDATLFGCGWGAERDVGDGEGGAVPSSWRDTGDLLRDGADGIPLPMGELEVRRVVPVRGDVTPLANLEGGEVLLARAPTDGGGLYFLTTTPVPADSNLATQGVVLVALVQRCLEAAADSVGSRLRRDAGRLDPGPLATELLSEPDPDGLLAERFEHAGVARVGEGLVVLERPEVEDLSPILPAGALTGAMPEVEWNLVRDASRDSGLVEEVWRVFLILLLVALVGEALLCVGESSPPSLAPAGRAGSRAGRESSEVPR